MEEKEAPAILIFKSYGEAIKLLSVEEAGRLMFAIVDCLGKGEEPDNLGDKEKIIYLMLKNDFERNEAEYKARKLREEKEREYFRKYQRRRKDATAGNDSQEGAESPPGAQETPPDSETPKADKTPAQKPTDSKTGKNQTRQYNLTREQAEFFEAFKEHCPDKALDCQIAEMPKVDYNALMLEIKRSPEFLKKHANLSLRWMLANAEDIISGKYRQHSDEVKHNFKQRDYTEEEMKALYRDVKDIEV